MDKALAAVADRLRRARRVLFITGAGLSADSGLPTYRGVGGLYEGRLATEDLPIEVVLSGQMLRERPELTWRYLLEIERTCRDARPNEGHHVMARIEQKKPDSWVVTQNVDGLHAAAGTRNLVEIHGRFSDLSCVRCSYTRRVADYGDLDAVPRCPECGDLVRPDVVLFGELLPERELATLRREVERGFDMVLSVGTTSGFPYIAEPVLLARQQGVPTVEINPGETEVSPVVEHRLRGRAAVVLQSLWEGAFGGGEPT